MKIVEYDLVVITVSLKVAFKDLEELLDDSQPLISAANTLKRELEDKDVEIFLQKDNILVTEEGYKILLYEESLGDIYQLREHNL